MAAQNLDPTHRRQRVAVASRSGRAVAAGLMPFIFILWFSGVILGLSKDERPPFAIPPIPPYILIVP